MQKQGPWPLAAAPARAPQRPAAAQGAELAGALLRCVAEPAAGAADAALDFFAALDEVPLAARAPPLRAPLAAGLSRALLAALAYPPGFAGWQDCELDEDAFERFRRARSPADGRTAGVCCAGSGGLHARSGRRAGQPGSSPEMCLVLGASLPVPAG